MGYNLNYYLPKDLFEKVLEVLLILISVFLLLLFARDPEVNEQRSVASKHLRVVEALDGFLGLSDVLVEDHGALS